MADLPFPWCIYGENQSKAAGCFRITDRSWGIENGLNNFLTAVESSSASTNPEELQSGIDRATSTGAWVERNHARLRRRYLQQQDEPHAERRMMARVRLAEIRSSVSESEWALLFAVASGFAYEQLAVRTGTAAGAVRTRVSRLRTRLSQVIVPARRG